VATSYLLQSQASRMTSRHAFHIPVSELGCFNLPCFNNDHRRSSRACIFRSAHLNVSLRTVSSIPGFALDPYLQRLLVCLGCGMGILRTPHGGDGYIICPCTLLLSQVMLCSHSNIARRCCTKFAVDLRGRRKTPLNRSGVSAVSGHRGMVDLFKVNLSPGNILL
jgi:hypothetical protein